MPKVIRPRSFASKRRFKMFNGKRFQLDTVFASKSAAVARARKIRSRFRLARVFMLPKSQTITPSKRSDARFKWAVYTRAD